MRWMFAGLLALSALACPAQAEEEKYSLHGEVRARYETLGGQFRAGLDGGDQLFSMRTSLRGKARIDDVTLTAELIDSRAYLGDEGGSISAGEVNALELVQAYANWDFGENEVLLGRFTMELGSNRLVERSNFRNTRNGFTGARYDRGGLTLFYTLPQTRLPDDKASLLDNEVAFDAETSDFTFWGAFYERSDLPFGATGEVFLFGLDDNRPGRDRHLLTPGFRILREKQGAIDVEIEAGLQRGDLNGLDVEAGYAHATLGYTWPAAWKPRLAFELDYATGDASPTDDVQQRFDPLFGSRTGDFGPTGIFGPIARANLISPGLRAEAKPHDRIAIDASYRAFWLDEPRDAFGGTGVRDASGLSGDFAGHLLETSLDIDLTDNLALETGLAALFKGDYFDRAPNANDEGDTLYGFTSLTLKF